MTTSAHSRRLLLAAAPFHQIAQRVESCLQALLDRTGIVWRLSDDRSSCRRHVRGKREVRHYLCPTVLCGHGQPSRVCALVGTPLDAAARLIDAKPAVIRVAPAPDLSMD